MSLSLLGLGWVTPLGSALDAVWERLMTGHAGEIKSLLNPEWNRAHAHMPVPPKLVERLGRTPRLRRSSPISYYAVAAGLAALEDAGLAPEAAARLGVIVTVCSGSVVYTRRFHDQIVKQGANAASPALFPETVYNAPASHLAAQLGVNGASYTLVGDNSVGLAGLKLAEQLITAREVDACLVVGTEELDWILCEAYGDWRIASAGAEHSLYSTPATGAMLAEGAGAVLVGRDGPGPRLTAIHPGAAFQSRRELTRAGRRVTEQLLAGEKPGFVVGSANGSWVDCSEAAIVTELLPSTPLYCPKAAFGEALGASALLQVVTAALALRHGELPPVINAGAAAPRTLVREALRGMEAESAFILTSGLNLQATGARLSR